MSLSVFLCIRPCMFLFQPMPLVFCLSFYWIVFFLLILKSVLYTTNEIICWLYVLQISSFNLQLIFSFFLCRVEQMFLILIRLYLSHFYFTVTYFIYLKFYEIMANYEIFPLILHHVYSIIGNVFFPQLRSIFFYYISLLFLHHLSVSLFLDLHHTQTGFPLLKHNIQYFYQFSLHVLLCSVFSEIMSNWSLILVNLFFYLQCPVLLSNTFKGDFYFYSCILLFYRHLLYYPSPYQILILFSSILSQKTSQLKKKYILFLSIFEVLLHCSFLCVFEKTNDFLFYH